MLDGLAGRNCRANPRLSQIHAKVQAVSARPPTHVRRETHGRAAASAATTAATAAAAADSAPDAPASTLEPSLAE